MAKIGPEIFSNDRKGNFGPFCRGLPEKLKFRIFVPPNDQEISLPLRKVAAKLDIDTSVLSKIERNERTATKEIVPVLSNV